VALYTMRGVVILYIARVTLSAHLKLSLKGEFG